VYLNSLAASDSEESVASLTYEGTRNSNNSHAQDYILLGLFEVDLYMKRDYFCQSCAQYENVCASSLRTEGVKMASFAPS